MLTTIIILVLVAVVSFALGYGYAQQKHSTQLVLPAGTELDIEYPIISSDFIENDPVLNALFGDMRAVEADGKPRFTVITNEDLP